MPIRCGSAFAQPKSPVPISSAQMRRDDGIGHEADTGLIGIRIVIEILEAFNDLSAHCGGKACIQSLAQILLIRDQALQHTHTGGQVTQSLDLHTGSGIDGGEEIRGIGERDCMVSTVFGNGIVDRGFRQTCNSIGAAINQIG